MKIWSRKSRLLLVENLHMYISVGIPTERAILAISENLPKNQKKSLRKVVDEVIVGRSLSKALRDEVKISSTIQSLIACGESTGTLSESLKSCHTLLSREDELIKKCLSAMAYPVLIGISAILLTIGLVRGIMPQIIPLLEGLNTKLPFITIVVMNVSGFLMDYGLIVLVSLVAGLTAIIVGVKKFTFIHGGFHHFLNAIPIIGSLVKSYSLSVFYMSFGSLCGAGVQTDKGFAQAVNSIGNLPLRSRLLKKISAIGQGEKVSIICDKSMPSYALPLISAGEASGSLANSLMKISTLLDNDMDHSLKRLTALIEPVMMIVMGAIVGSIALSIMMPIYDISKTLQT